MSDFDVKTENLKQVVNALTEAGEKQIPFATAKALTQTAKDAQKYVQEHLSDDFTIRSTWVEKGIRVNPAKKKHLFAEVGSKDEFMRLHAKGGIKFGRSKALGVPIEGGARPKKTSKVTPAKWPGKLLAKPKHFIAPIKGGPQVGVWKRRYKKTWKYQGRGKNRRRVRTPIQLMYAFRSNVKVPKRWKFDENVKKTVKSMWRRNAYLSLKRALETANPPIKAS